VIYNTGGTRPVDEHKDAESPFEAKDLSGNVWEWCWDWYNDYNPEDLIDPMGPEKGKFNSRVLRGGSWRFFHQDYFRCANRNNNHPDNRNKNVGFRLGKDLKTARL